MSDRMNGQVLDEHFRVPLDGACEPGAVFRGDCWRICVLTACLIRFEYSPGGVFIDRPSQRVLNRKFPLPSFSVQDSEELLVIDTGRVRLSYDKNPFSRNGLSAEIFGSGIHYGNRWHYGIEREEEFISRLNYKGTARTLDNCDGATDLEDGIISKHGFAVLDDSASLLLRDDGFVEQRAGAGSAVDFYLFAYGRDFKTALADFYTLTGPVPVLPRWALGNWWSRYYAYRQDEYLELMDRFKSEQVPFSVAVIDMDWHKTAVPERFGSGWTGYSWNRELFPDPETFLAELHRRGMRTTLNLHPADGIRPFEDCYEQAAGMMGLDPAEGKSIGFDMADPRFIQTYFKAAHNPLEQQGVDFWWIDWQQGGITRMDGLDPLWMLNHYHYLDAGRNGKRSLIFSRYAGPGSHRYPVGFSGDTITSWKSLAFQPYFTATAANIGYGWWSHDIGGHMKGRKDDELVARWVQFGVFSPINRLHSSCSPFNSKEPWRYGAEAAGIIGGFLRLRHRLIPYLHAMNTAAAQASRPVCLPLYYEFPWEWKCYELANAYWFGTQLLCFPVTSPRDPHSLLAGVDAWVPPGLWFDFFSGKMYDGGDAKTENGKVWGGRSLRMYRFLDRFPVLARAGALIPLAGGDSTDNPEDLVLTVFPGANGSFDLPEDDDLAVPESASVTPITLTWPETAARRRTAVLTIAGARPTGSASDTSVTHLPVERRWTVVLRGWETGLSLRAVPIDENGNTCGGPVRLRARPRSGAADGIPGLSADCDRRIELPPCPVNKGYRLEITGMNLTAVSDRMTDLFGVLDRSNIGFELKDRIWYLARDEKDSAQLAAALSALDVDRELLQALMEILLV